MDNKNQIKSRSLLAVGVAAIALAGAAPAVTGAATVKSKVAITSISTKGAEGKVTSKQAKCEKRRKVKLKFVGEYGPVTIGSTTTNTKGAWKLKEKLTDKGIYYATVKKTKKCSAATSKDKRLR